MYQMLLKKFTNNAKQIIIWLQNVVKNTNRYWKTEG